jgi:hypothetical protein
MERPSIVTETSTKSKERSTMSAADDVLDMKDITGELADRLVGSGADIKVRVHAVLRAINTGARQSITDNRALEFLKGKARRVDAWEKENAKRQLEQLRRSEAIEQITNLNRTLAYLRQVDPDGYGSHIAAMEHTLAAAGVLDRSVAPTSTQPEEGR